jgi:hypothetical protein
MADVAILLLHYVYLPDYCHIHVACFVLVGSAVCIW